jgi:AcrR family transcriptional regulator
MVRTAYELFTERGYPATTMGAIAERAGVAVQTLHFTFGTKAALLQNTYDYAVLGEGEQRPPELQPWYGAFLNAETLSGALRILMDNVAEVMARTAPLDDFVRSASHEPDAARIRSHTEMLRRRAWNGMIESLAGRFGLRRYDQQQAVDILMLLMSPASYQTLVSECGWTTEQWRTWCTQAVRLQLFTEGTRR